MKPFKIIYYVFLAAIVVIGLLLIFSLLPVSGNFRVMVVQSGSMEPVIKGGAVVIVRPVETYKINDVITFRQRGKAGIPITHRIVGIKVEEGNLIYITKGDANDANDAREIRDRDILGKVLFDIPYVGYAVAAAQKPIGFMALIIIPAALIMYDQGIRIWKEIKKKKEKTNNTPS